MENPGITDGSQKLKKSKDEKVSKKKETKKLLENAEKRLVSIKIPNLSNRLSLF